MPQNEDAEFIYSVVEDQWILSQNGPVAINQTAIHQAMELYEIENRRACFEKVMVLARYFIGKMNKGGAS